MRRSLGLRTRILDLNQSIKFQRARMAGMIRREPVTAKLSDGGTIGAPTAYPHLLREVLSAEGSAR